MHCLIIIATLACSAFASRQQTIGVKGQILCGTEPLQNARIKLWNKNMLNFDDQLAESKTDEEGNFRITGTLGAYFGLTPHLKIYHTCGHQLKLFSKKFKKPCARKIDLKIPSDFVSRGTEAEEYYNVGVLNMLSKFPGEQTKCFL